MFILTQNKMNWSDEFDIFGIRLYKLEDFTLIFNELSKHDRNKEIEWYFGSNQCLDYTLGKYLDTITTQLISEKEAKFLIKIFPGIYTYGIGQCADLGDLLERILDE